MCAIVRWAHLSGTRVVEAVGDFVVLRTTEQFAHRRDVLGPNRYIV
jgi:hypothetical protein